MVSIKQKKAAKKNIKKAQKNGSLWVPDSML
jgi:hypothetical protein